MYMLARLLCKFTVHLIPPGSSPYIVRKGDGVDGLLEFTILAYKDGIPYPVGDDSFNIRV